MTADEDWLAGAWPGSDACAPARPPRACAGCGRPHLVCLCSSLPPHPLAMAGQVFVLQHPAEAAKQALCTAPLVPRVLAGAAVCVGRTFKGPKCPPALAAALAEAAAVGTPVLVLFPGGGAPSVADVAAVGVGGGGGSGGGDGGSGAAPAAASAVPPPPSAACSPNPHPVLPPVRGRPYVLLAIDGTWERGKEMFKALSTWLLWPAGPGVRVQLPLVGSSGKAGATCDGEASPAAGPPRPAFPHPPTPPITPRFTPYPSLAASMFMEPHAGCLTTAGAVGVAVAELEPSAEPGTALLAALGAMTAHQARFDPAVAARLAGEGARVSTSERRFGFRNPDAV